MNYKGVKDQVFQCLECGTDIPYKGPSYRHKYCSSECSSKHRKQSKLKTVSTLFAEGQLTARRHIYKLLVERDGNKCSVCGIDSWNNKPIRFWVDHIDGNASNNHPSNFRLICPNCDCQSETFGSKNRGQGRKAKGLPMYG